MRHEIRLPSNHFAQSGQFLSNTFADVDRKLLANRLQLTANPLTLLPLVLIVTLYPLFEYSL